MGTSYGEPGARVSIHLYQAREAVECYAARAAAQLGGDAVDYVDKTVESVADIDLDDVRAVYKAHRSVHRAIVDVLDNPVLLALFDEIWGARLRDVRRLPDTRDEPGQRRADPSTPRASIA